MSLITQDIESIDKETEYAEGIRGASKEVLIGRSLDALEGRIPIEPFGYLALRELCLRGKVAVELLLWAHSLAQ